MYGVHVLVSVQRLQQHVWETPRLNSYRPLGHKARALSRRGRLMQQPKVSARVSLPPLPTLPTAVIFELDVHKLLNTAKLHR